MHRNVPLDLTPAFLAVDDGSSCSSFETFISQNDGFRYGGVSQTITRVLVFCTLGMCMQEQHFVVQAASQGMETDRRGVAAQGGRHAVRAHVCGEGARGRAVARAAARQGARARGGLICALGRLAA